MNKTIKRIFFICLLFIIFACGTKKNFDDCFYFEAPYLSVSAKTTTIIIKNKTDENHTLKVDFYFKIKDHDEYTLIYSKENLEVRTEQVVTLKDEALLVDEISQEYELDDFMSEFRTLVVGDKVVITDEQGVEYIKYRGVDAK